MAFEDILSFRYAGRQKPSIPSATRKAVEQRAGGICECCHERKKLELHHRHYETEGRESPDDLMAYCRECHKRAHIDKSGDFWVDPQEMENRWATYYERNDD